MTPRNFWSSSITLAGSFLSCCPSIIISYRKRSRETDRSRGFRKMSNKSPELSKSWSRVDHWQKCYLVWRVVCEPSLQVCSVESRDETAVLERAQLRWSELVCWNDLIETELQCCWVFMSPLMLPVRLKLL